MSDPIGPVKITYVIGSLATGGAERQLMELLLGLDRIKWEPSLVLFDDLDFDRARQLVTQVYSLGISSNGNSKSRFRGAKATKAIVRLTRILRDIGPRIVHTILPASFVIAAPAARLLRTPVLVGSRRSHVDCYRSGRITSAVDRIATRMCDFVLGNSASVTEEIIRIDGVSEARAKTIYNGVNVVKFRPGDRSVRARYGWQDDQIVFGIVANFIPYKRHVDFVHASALIAEQVPESCFVMAGEDRGVLDEIRAQIEFFGLGKRVTIIPGIEDPASLYRAMDVYICSSETEGLSNVLLEAAATELPIVATRVGGNSEIVNDMENGLLVPPRSPDLLAIAAMTLAKNPNLRSSMGRCGRARVEQLFSLNAMVTQHEELYERLLRGADNTK